MIPIFFLAALGIHFGSMGADAPARGPQMAANASMTAFAFGAGNAIYFSSSADGGKTFGAPIKVAEAGVVLLSHHRGPRVALCGNAIVITAVAGDKPDGQGHGLPYEGDLMAWRSQDGGKTWSRGTAINDMPGSAAEGLHTLASDGKGTLFAAWLDHRVVKGKKLYAARSTDGGLTWSKNVAIYESPSGSICECCHPSAAINAAGEVAVMWRNSLGGARDMYLATSRDGMSFPEARKLGNGTWELNACPMDGGGLAISSGRIVTAWRRDANVFLDEPGQPERQVGKGKDVALALSGGRTYVAWVDGSKVEVWVDGKVETLSSSGAFPSLVSLPGGGVMAAWEEGGGVEIRRVK
jgi:hypothetical protein